MSKQIIDFGTVFTGKAVGTLDYDEEHDCHTLTVDGVMHNFDEILEKCYGGEIEFKAVVPVEEEE